MHMNEIRENALIASLVKGFPRSPLQRNGLQESDAELVRLPGTDALLAVTTDTIVEEIESGLYKDPYLMGWMTVTASASDLAAVGAEPLGILLSETLPQGLGADFASNLQQGVRDACSVCGLYLLGGDTSLSSRLHLSASALGLLPDGLAVTRMGCSPGDVLFASGRLGRGSAYAFVQLTATGQGLQFEFPYRPLARLREGQMLRPFASSCIDTSDGFLAALDQLMRLNGVGFRVEAEMEELLDNDTFNLSRAANIPAWMALAGPHGEFELVFTVPPERVEALLAEASRHEWQPKRLGRVVPEPGVWLCSEGQPRALDTGRIRNLFDECAGDIHRYFRGLLNMQAALEGEKEHER